MINSRAIGLNQIYLDSEIDGFSNIGVGILIRSLGHGLKVCYVDVGGGCNRLTNLFENLSLSSNFVKNFKFFNCDFYNFTKNKNILSRSIIPLVEFSNINKNLFLNSLRNYDILIFENCNLEKFSKNEISNILNFKNEFSEIIFTFSDKNEYHEVKNLFNLKSKYNYKSQKNLFTNNKIIDITGNGRGKSLYSFGYIIKRFINKDDIKLIYFDKEDFYYGEMVFFKALKEWSKLNKYYGNFDFVITGMKRIFGLNYRSENIYDDYIEAEEAIKLLKTSVKKQSCIIAD